MHNSTGDTRENLLAKISYQWAQSNPAAAFAWAQNLSEATARDAVLPGLVSVVAEDNPGSAAELVSRLPGDMQPLAASSLISQWAGADPQAASVWAASFPDAETRDQLFANVMNRWAKTDPTAAATWLQTLPCGFFTGCSSGRFRKSNRFCRPARRGAMGFHNQRREYACHGDCSGPTDLV